MSDTGTKPQNTGGAFIPNSVIYDKVLDIDKRMTRVETIFTLVTFIVAPATSAIVSLLIGQTYNG